MFKVILNLFVCLSPLLIPLAGYMLYCAFEDFGSVYIKRLIGSGVCVILACVALYFGRTSGWWGDRSIRLGQLFILLTVIMTILLAKGFYRWRKLLALAWGLSVILVIVGFLILRDIVSSQVAVRCNMHTDITLLEVYFDANGSYPVNLKDAYQSPYSEQADEQLQLPNEEYQECYQNLEHVYWRYNSVPSSDIIYLLEDRRYKLRVTLWYTQYLFHRKDMRICEYTSDTKQFDCYFE